jgi:phage major head subunit gpT-like protein
MIINDQNLDFLYYTFNALYQKGFAKPSLFFDKFATVVPSSNAVQLYPWVGRTTVPREWLGERQIQSIERHGYQIRNREYEDTIGVPVPFVEDDSVNTMGAVFEQLGYDVATFPDKMVAQMLNNATSTVDQPANANAVLAYDGVTFFSATGHPVGLAGKAPTLAPNAITSGTGSWWFLFDVSRPLRPVIVQKRKEWRFLRMNAPTDEGVFMNNQIRYGTDARMGFGVGFWQFAVASNADLTNSDNFAAAVSMMQQIKQDNGQPFGAGAQMDESGLILMVPPSLRQAANLLLKAELIAAGAGGRGGASGPYSNVWYQTALPLVNPWLADSVLVG